MAELIRVSSATDFEEIAAFQRRAFGEEWLKSERRRLQCAEYYHWKYFPPAGPAWLAVVRSGHELVAMLAAVPFALAAAGRGGSTAWQICDIATDPRFRRRGLFARCLAALAGTVETDMTFCFPNRQSRAGLVKAGYAARSVLRLRGIPMLGFAAGPSAASVGSTELMDYDSALRIGPWRIFSVQRSPDFLRWRYAAHPLNRYAVVSTVGAASVVRRLVNGRVGVVLETCSASDDGLQAGRKAARQWAKNAGCFALLWASDRHMAATTAALRWQRPWDIVCYTRGDPGASFGSPESRLHVQLGDWDAV